MGILTIYIRQTRKIWTIWAYFFRGQVGSKFDQDLMFIRRFKSQWSHQKLFYHLSLIWELLLSGHFNQGNISPSFTESQGFLLLATIFHKQKVEIDENRTQDSCLEGQNLTNLAMAAKWIPRKFELFFKWKVKLRRKNMPKLFRKFAFGKNGEYLIKDAQ